MADLAALGAAAAATNVSGCPSPSLPERGPVSGPVLVLIEHPPGGAYDRNPCCTAGRNWFTVSSRIDAATTLPGRRQSRHRN